MMNLNETIHLMKSSDYIDRFIAEYWQTKIRYDRLHDMVVKYEANNLNFKPDCPLELLKEQKAAMGKYLYCMEVRAQIEHVDLKSFAAQMRKQTYGRYYKYADGETDEVRYLTEQCRREAREFLQEKNQTDKADQIKIIHNKKMKTIGWKVEIEEVV